MMARNDVTDLLKYEEERNKRLGEALQVAQMANSSKSDFLASMSHDIRTPMNAIVGMCELALDDEKDEKQIHESLTIIKSSSQLLLSLINNILDMSRIESGKMQFNDAEFSITQEINNSYNSYLPLVKQKNQKLMLHINVTHDILCGDKIKLHSAIDNVLANAIKYTKEKGTIIFRVLEQKSNNSGMAVYRFEISDNGIGIDKEKQKHIFEPFYKVDTNETERIEGSGLGLSIAKAIIDLKGGTISLKSTKNVGTTFIIELPIHLANQDAVVEGAQEKVEDKH